MRARWRTSAAMSSQLLAGGGRPSVDVSRCAQLAWRPAVSRFGAVGDRRRAQGVVRPKAAKELAVLEPPFGGMPHFPNVFLVFSQFRRPGLRHTVLAALAGSRQ